MRQSAPKRYWFAWKLCACAVMTAYALSIGVARGAAAELPASGTSAVTTSEPPVSAPATGTSSSPLRASAHIQLQQLVKATRVAEVRRAQDGTSGDHDDPGAFFKTKRGATLLVIAAAGIGYMWYSKFHDRIHSQVRERVNH